MTLSPSPGKPSLATPSSVTLAVLPFGTVHGHVVLGGVDAVAAVEDVRQRVARGPVADQRVVAGAAVQLVGPVAADQDVVALVAVVVVVVGLVAPVLARRHDVVAVAAVGGRREVAVVERVVAGAQVDGDRGIRRVEQPDQLVVAATGLEPPLRLVRALGAAVAVGLGERDAARAGVHARTGDAHLRGVVVAGWRSRSASRPRPCRARRRRRPRRRRWRPGRLPGAARAAAATVVVRRCLSMAGSLLGAPPADIGGLPLSARRGRRRSSTRRLMPSLRKQRLRWCSTVLGARKSAAPTSRLVIPLAACMAIWSSCGVSSATSTEAASGAADSWPPVARSSAWARAAQPVAPRRSKVASASRSGRRASERRRTRRRRSPCRSWVRAVSNGCGVCACRASARSNHSSTSSSAHSRPRPRAGDRLRPGVAGPPLALALQPLDALDGLVLPARPATAPRSGRA